MKEYPESIEEMVKKLPPEYQEEVKDFIKFLFEKKLKKTRERPSFKWAGALRDLRDYYTSVELHHKIAEWRIGEK